MILLSGRYRASCVILAMPRHDAARIAASNCELLEQSLTPSGTHPLVLLMGEHWDVRIRLLPFRVSYHEALIAIPWVRRRGKPCGTAPLANVSRLWLDKLAPVIGGRVVGFPKIWSRIGSSTDHYAVRSLLTRRPLITARFGKPGAAVPAMSVPNFVSLSAVFEQTFLQRLFVIGPSCVETLDFHLPEAVLWPIEAEVEIHPGAMKAFPAGRHRLQSIDSTPLGAFRLELPWTLTVPSRCRASS